MFRLKRFYVYFFFCFVILGFYHTKVDEKFFISTTTSYPTLNSNPHPNLNGFFFNSDLISNASMKSPPNVKFNMFFVESNLKRTEIGIKQMCAIESAAMHNPLASIQVYSLQAKLNSNASFLLNAYQNIQIVPFNPEQLLNDSNLLSFWKNGSVHKSQFSYSHLSDFIRSVEFSNGI